MKILIYKRTHNGDPDEEGCFGAYDCMGSVRGWNYDAAIGVGGIGQEAQRYGIDGKINWIGVEPHKKLVKGKRGPEVTFDHFLFFGKDGENLREKAPALAHRLYDGGSRFLFRNYSKEERKEAESIVAMAMNAEPSKALLKKNNKSGDSRKCKSAKKTLPCGSKVKKECSSKVKRKGKC